ncbi:hypothetical protein SAMN05878426_101514 [Phaeovulum vinaykumarii]|uniref:Pilus assembly protein n=2 Tax=Phaeovulum vinaykumarii TaxID=407234 RepID=A0A1N7K0X2_9RHOB|nr:hypothetical protein SAMN05421795_101516 [Phaeovulum vinaykumarii]SOB92284.1 hypothetical protein SAMN05878426_101514 [Phaeovulum vinaykumarii]
MQMFKIVKKFNAEEEGAVTVDWVVLTAAVVGLGLAALNVVRTGTSTASNTISGELAKTSIKSTF